MKNKANFSIGLWLFLGIAFLMGCIPLKPNSTDIKIPLQTQTLTLIPMPIATIQPTPLPESTVPVEPANIAQVPVSHEIEESISPDGNWKTAIDTTRVELGENRDLLNIVFWVKSTDGKTDFLLEDYAALDQPLEGYWYPYIFKWSADGKSLYYSHIRSSNDGCFVLNEPGGLDFVRLDLLTGETETLSNGGTYMALSPHESLLAYNNDWGSFLTIKNLNSLVENDYHSPAKTIGNIPGYVTDIIWSPDGNYLAYTFIGSPCNFPANSSIVLMDVRNRNSKILIDVSETDYYAKEFLNSNTILLEGEQTGVPASLFTVNISTGEIAPVQ